MTIAVMCAEGVGVSESSWPSSLLTVNWRRYLLTVFFDVDTNNLLYCPPRRLQHVQATYLFDEKPSGLFLHGQLCFTMTA